MYPSKDIILTADYHLRNIEVRQFNGATGEEKTFNTPTQRERIEAFVDRAVLEATAQGGRVVFIMESTTGWARMKDLLRDRVEFFLCNVLQMPLPPKGRRRKTDKIDTGRMQREYLNGSLPRAYQPLRELRELRRLVGLREDLVERRTAVRNWITSYLSHETWESTGGLWTKKGKERLERFVEAGGLDGFSVGVRVRELDALDGYLADVEEKMLALYRQCPDAQRIDRIRGIGPLGALVVYARIGRAERFADAEKLVSYAGLAPGVFESDDTRRSGRIGGGGTDAILRRYLIQASVWAREIPRYVKTYERALARRGKKVARLVVCRMLLRSLYKMLRDGVEFDPAPAAAA